MLLACLFCASGCAGVMAPPGRHAGLPAAEPVEVGSYEVSGATSIHLAHAIYPGAPGLAGELELRTGVVPRVVLQAGGSVFPMFSENRPDSLWKSYLFSGRTGLAFHPEAAPKLSLEAGVSGGYSAAGGFVSGDLGIVTGLVEADRIEFLQRTSAYVSFPVARRPVTAADIGQQGTEAAGEPPDFPEVAGGGAGVTQGLSLNLIASEPTPETIGLEFRFGSGATVGMDSQRDRSQVTLRFDYWLGMAAAFQL